MSGIKRYRFDGVDLVGGFPDGRWVEHEDHLAVVKRLEMDVKYESEKRREAVAEINRLRALVRELADDLEARIKAEYGHALQYKHIRLGYGAEMSLVREARAALEE